MPATRWLTNPTAWVMITTMPTVLRERGFDIMIYLNDHPPPHVHVFRAEGEVVINLGEGETPPPGT